MFILPKAIATARFFWYNKREEVFVRAKLPHR
jgi:hypothetical protein